MNDLSKIGKLAEIKPVEEREVRINRAYSKKLGRIVYANDPELCKQRKNKTTDFGLVCAHDCCDKPLKHAGKPLGEQLQAPHFKGDGHCRTCDLHGDAIRIIEQNREMAIPHGEIEGYELIHGDGYRYGHVVPDCVVRIYDDEKPTAVEIIVTNDISYGKSRKYIEEMVDFRDTLYVRISKKIVEDFISEEDFEKYVLFEAERYWLSEQVVLGMEPHEEAKEKAIVSFGAFECDCDDGVPKLVKFLLYSCIGEKEKEKIKDIHHIEYRRVWVMLLANFSKWFGSKLILNNPKNTIHWIWWACRPFWHPSVELSEQQLLKEASKFTGWPREKKHEDIERVYWAHHKQWILFLKSEGHI